MKVRTWVDTEVEVDVSLGDVLGALTELPDSERLPSMLSAINTAYGILSRIPDASIGEMNDTQRKLIVDGLAQQAARYAAV